jgi:hypothetical protein
MEKRFRMLLAALLHHKFEELFRLVPLVPCSEDYYFRYERAYDYPADFSPHLFSLSMMLR